MFNRIRTTFVASKNTAYGKLRSLSSSAKAGDDEKYSGAMQAMHWAMGGSVVACVGLVNVAQFYKGKEKMNIMFYHKSFGLLAAGLIAPRILLRFASKIPAPVSGNAVEVFAAKAGHAALYAFMIFMPATGVAMGYFGGKGLPFFTTTIPGAEKPDGKIAKQTFELHSKVGHYAQYLIPAHVGAVGFHFLVKGKNILPRMLPWGK
jgi:cytochrome b561